MQNEEEVKYWDISPPPPFPGIYAYTVRGKCGVSGGQADDVSIQTLLTVSLFLSLFLCYFSFNFFFSFVPYFLFLLRKFYRVWSNPFNLPCLQLG